MFQWLHERTARRLHLHCLERFPTYAAWHEHPYHGHTHWALVGIFLAGTLFGFFAHVFLPEQSAFAATVGTPILITSTPYSGQQTGVTSDMVLRSSGFPYIVATSLIEQDIFVVDCSVATCTTATRGFFTTSNLYNGGAIAVRMHTDGFPVIATVDVVNGALHAFHCNDILCLGDTPTVVDAAGVDVNTVSMVLNGAGNPVIAYQDSTISDRLKVIVCGDDECTAGNVTTTVESGTFSSINLLLDGSGFPMISYYDTVATALKFAHCSAIDCTGVISGGALDSAGDVGSGNSMVLDGSGRPMISYGDLTAFGNFALKYVHCGDTNCSFLLGTGAITLDATNVGATSAIALASTGFPVISYSDHTNFEQKVVYCGNANCSSGNDTVILDGNGAPTGDNVLGWESSVITASNRLLVSYYDITNGNLKFNYADANSAPTASTPTSISQATDGSGYVTFQTTITDADANTTILAVEMFDGSAWKTVSAASLAVTAATNATGITVATEGSGYHIQGITTTASNTLTIRIASQSLSNLTSSSHPNIQIRVTPNDGTAEGSVATSVQFEVDNAPPTGLGALSVGTPTATTIPLTWASAASDAHFSHYEIWYGTNQSHVQNRTGTATEWDNSDVSNLASSSTTSTTITGLSASTLYYVKLFAVDASGNSMTVADQNVTTTSGGSAAGAATTGSGTAPAPTPGDQTPPSQPTSIVVTAAPTRGVQITWVDPSETDLAAVHVLKGIDPLPPQQIVSVSPGVQMYHDTVAMPGVPYTYALRVVDHSLNQALSPLTSFTIPLVPPEEEGEAASSLLDLRRLLLVQYPPRPTVSPCTSQNVHCSPDERLQITTAQPLGALLQVRSLSGADRRDAPVANVLLGTITNTETRIIGRAGRIYNFVAPAGAMLPSMTLRLTYNVPLLSVLMRGGVRVDLVHMQEGAETWERVPSASHDAIAGTYTLTNPAQGRYALVLVRDIPINP